VVADKPVNNNWGIERQREFGLLDPTLVFYAPDGSILAESDDLENGLATDAYIDSITLPQTGIYRIEVRSYQTQTGGGYRLILADPRPLIIQTSALASAGLAIDLDGRKALGSRFKRGSILAP
jgi:hypothetical protein